MRALACLLSSLLICLNGLLTPPVRHTTSLFLFLSLRMKGNGDGSITALVQNEFAIGSSVFPVTVSLYRSDEYTSNLGQMTLVESLSIEDLNIFQTLTITHTVTEPAYYCAVAYYTVGREEKYQQCNTVYYDADGNRA